MFAENKYSRWYFSIIEAARTSPKEGYIEKRHIHPTSMGGADASEDLVKLPVRAARALNTPTMGTTACV